MGRHSRRGGEESSVSIDRQEMLDTVCRIAVVAGEAILKVKEQCGYEDFMFHAWFETGGFRGEEVETQMQYFAEEVMPRLARACGNQVKNPDIGVDFASPNGKAR